MKAIRKIMVPVDFSPISERVLGHAARFAADLDAELVVAHVIQPSEYQAIISVDNFPGLVDDVRRRSEAALQALARRLPPKLRRTVALLEGRAFEEILACASAQHVDLIVMGTHGRTGLQHWMLGSTAERVVRLATCPVLTMTPATASAFDPPA